MKKKKTIYYREPRLFYLIAFCMIVFSLCTIKIWDEIMVMVGLLLVAIVQNETKRERKPT